MLAARRDTCAVAALALGLLAMTLYWHVPMMLWDHLDLVPMQDALRNGEGVGRDFWLLHGGHWHTAAYAVLLLTTSLSGGQPWLDSVASWMLLLAYATVIAAFAREPMTNGERLRDSRWWLLLMAFALYPGHLANLQWGWQVAVFSCLLGVVAAIYCLTRPRLQWWHNLIALFAAITALASFATAIAIVPTCLILLALRPDVSRTRRFAMAMPWLVVGIGLVSYYRSLTLHDASTEAGVFALTHYSLNFVGAGISRFATDLAPLIALAALAVVAAPAWTGRYQRTCLPWIALMLFGLFSAGAVALGRAGPFGPEHAFVTRYVSFSSMFWLGWTGVVLSSVRLPLQHRRMPTVALSVVLGLAAVNSLHMISKAAKVGESSRITAVEIRNTWPNVDEQLLRSIYFDQPETARKRLEKLHEWEFAPFRELKSPP